MLTPEEQRAAAGMAAEIEAWARENNPLNEGLEILLSLQESIRRHGNYSPESTIVFLDQAASCFRDAIRSDYAARIERLEGALRASEGYLLNARIDLETGTKKATTIATIGGGLKVVRAALQKEPSE